MKISEKVSSFQIWVAPFENLRWRLDMTTGVGEVMKFITCLLKKTYYYRVEKYYLGLNYLLYPVLYIENINVSKIENGESNMAD